MMPHMLPVREFRTAWLWDVGDVDTPKVLVPLSPEEYGLHAVIAVRVRDLRVPESNTAEGQAVITTVARELLQVWMPLQVTTYNRSFTRYQGDIWLPQREASYRAEVERIMQDLGIQPGGK